MQRQSPKSEALDEMYWSVISPLFAEVTSVIKEIEKYRTNKHQKVKEAGETGETFRALFHAIITVYGAKIPREKEVSLMTFKDLFVNTHNNESFFTNRSIPLISYVNLAQIEFLNNMAMLKEEYDEEYSKKMALNSQPQKEQSYIYSKFFGKGNN